MLRTNALATRNSVTATNMDRVLEKSCLPVLGKTTSNTLARRSVAPILRMGLKRQNVNDTCKSSRRFELVSLYGRPASPLDSPNCGELKLPIGGRTFTLLNTFRAAMLKVSP
jgi:hypothetical protein